MWRGGWDDLETLRPLGFGEVLDSGFAIYRRGFVAFVTITAIAEIPSALVSLLAYGTASRPQHASTLASGALSAAFILVTIVSGLLSLLMAGALIAYTASFFGAGASTPAAAYALSLRRFGRLFGYSLLYGLTTMVGLILFVIPGVIFGISFSLGLQAILLEDRTVWQAFGRSYSLVRGAFWRFLGIFLVTLIIVLVVSTIIQSPFGGAGLFAAAHHVGTTSVILSLIGSLVANILLASVLEIMETVLYFDRRARQEGNASTPPGIV
jgi:hypothetical protein